MGFPAVVTDEKLARRDFYRFELQFAKAVHDLFPCRQVQFLTEGLGQDRPPAGLVIEERTWAGLALARELKRPLADAGSDCLFLPIYGQDELLAVAQLSATDPVLAGRSEEWLEERCRLLTREFGLIKGWAQDPMSGALNAGHLCRELDLLLALPPAAEDNLYLLFIEVSLRSKDAAQASQDIARTAAHLDALVGDQAPIHHLGAGVFALIWHGEDLERCQRLGYALLRKLKRQGSHRVHIAIQPLQAAGRSEPGAARSGTELALNGAWDTLAIARRRGITALSVASDAQAGPHLLAPLPAAVLSQLKRLWQKDNQFSIVFLQKDIQGPLDSFPGRIRALAGEGATLIELDPHRALIYLAGVEEQLAADWAGSFSNHIRALNLGTFSMGIASYPCPGFHKADIPANAKKALVHTQFFGAGTITSFSEVSLNISGDVYYNEGDLLSAIREYRLGLNLNPDNINLLNSLGVIYAQIDSYAKAIPLFERALRLNASDFMALCNLGFAHLCQGASDKALNYFEQAVKIDDRYFDLLLQMGQLYCQRGQYRQAIKVLTKAEAAVGRDSAPGGQTAAGSPPEPWPAQGQSLGHGLVYRYLGEAYKAIGKPREAMTYLQRAARYNSQDSESLSLLGELYALENQGLDIALAFCRQAVAIDPTKASHWLRLARVLESREGWDEALTAVQRALALEPKHLAALMLKAGLHQRLEQIPQARAALEKVLRYDGTHAQATKALKKLNLSRR